MNTKEYVADSGVSYSALDLIIQPCKGCNLPSHLTTGYTGGYLLLYPFGVYLPVNKEFFLNTADCRLFL